MSMGILTTGSEAWWETAWLPPPAAPAADAAAAPDNDAACDPWWLPWFDECPPPDFLAFLGGRGGWPWLEADDATDGAVAAGLPEEAAVARLAGWLLLLPSSSVIPSPDPTACGWWSRRACRRLLRSSRAEARARAAADDDPPPRASEGVADESEAAAAAAAAADAALADVAEAPCFLGSVTFELALVPSVGLDEVEDGVALLVVPDAMGGV